MLDTFDGARADRTFQHLVDPVAALTEPVRVVRLADRVLAFRAGVGHWRLAHQMRRLYVEAGLGETEAECVPIVLQEPTALDNALGLRSWAGLAYDQGLLAAHDAGCVGGGDRRGCRRRVVPLQLLHLHHPRAKAPPLTDSWLSPETSHKARIGIRPGRVPASASTAMRSRIHWLLLR